MFCLKYKRENPSHVLQVPYAVCVNLLWDQEVVAFTHTLGFQDSRLCRELSDQFSCYIKELKETQAGVLVLAEESKKKGVCGLGACTWLCQ